MPITSVIKFKVGGNFHSSNAFDPFITISVTLRKIIDINIAEFEMVLDKFGTYRYDLT